MTADDIATLRADLKAGFAELRAEMKSLNRRDDDGEKVHDDHEVRIRTLERLAAGDKVRWSVVAKVAGISAGGGFALGAALIKFFGG